MSVYKGTEVVGTSESYDKDNNVEKRYPLDGVWSDSAYYRCLFEYSDPYISPTFSEPIAIAYFGFYRSSMYSYSTSAAATEQKMKLLKADNTDMDVYCYLQTKKLPKYNR